MATSKILAVSMIAIGLLFIAPDAKAHCDSIDGPVAKAVVKALETGNVNPVLAYAPASAENEIRGAFEQARKVRTLGADARALADKAFMETAIRLHRAGEGAPFTGVKPAGIDYGPAVPAADTAVETGDLAKLKAVLTEELDHALRERFAHVRETQKASKEPKSTNDVPAARERIEAELGFVTFAEVVRQAILGKGAEQHVD